MRVERASTKNNGKPRKQRSNKKIRVCPYFTQEQHRKLNRLARACGVKETEMMLTMFDALIDNPAFVKWVQQEKFRLSEDDPFYISHVPVNGEIYYGE